MVGFPSTEQQHTTQIVVTSLRNKSFENRLIGGAQSFYGVVWDVSYLLSCVFVPLQIRRREAPPNGVVNAVYRVPRNVKVITTVYNLLQYKYAGGKPHQHEMHLRGLRDVF